MLQTVKTDNRKAIKKIFKNMLLDVPGLFDMKKSTVDELVNTINLYLEHLKNQISKLLKEMNISKSSDKSTQFTELGGLRRKRDLYFLLANYTVILDEELFQEILDRINKTKF